MGKTTTISSSSIITTNTSSRITITITINTTNRSRDPRARPGPPRAATATTRSLRRATKRPRPYSPRPSSRPSRPSGPSNRNAARTPSGSSAASPRTRNWPGSATESSSRNKSRPRRWHGKRPARKSEPANCCSGRSGSGLPRNKRRPLSGGPPSWWPRTGSPSRSPGPVAGAGAGEENPQRCLDSTSSRNSEVPGLPRARWFRPRLWRAHPPFQAPAALLSAVWTHWEEKVLVPRNASGPPLSFPPLPIWTGS
mmetsp:Transcript_11601/g.33389  ORF Transcript_11601/g.33389 Transcript_11601/m.33389 type:complete len:254 (-) Transcript_11601:1166-1927(-)